jgi:hypothetical protein
MADQQGSDFGWHAAVRGMNTPAKEVAAADTPAATPADTMHQALAGVIKSDTARVAFVQAVHDAIDAAIAKFKEEIGE